MFLTLFDQHVASRPEKIALHFGAAALTYAEVGARVESMVCRLLNKGFRRGDHLAVLLENSLHYPSLLFAALRVGVVLVPFSPRMAAEQLRIGFASADVGAIIFDSSNCALAAQDFDFPCLDLSHPADSVDCASKLSRDVIVNPMELGEPFIIVSTSGSTSAPKPILLTQAVKWARFQRTVETYGLGDEDVFIVATPLYHSLAQRFTLMALALGATLVLMDRFRPQPYLEAMSHYGVTFAMAVSNQIEALIPILSEQYDLSSLKTLVSSSYSISAQAKQRLLEVVSANIYECYGASEVGCATNLAVRQYPDKTGSVGLPLPYVQIRIFDDNGNPVDGVGEIAVKTPTAFSGYYGMPEATQASLNDGFFLTGDLGFIDADGFLYYAGRKKDLIKTGAISVYPIDVERVIMALPGVDDCAVVGVPDAYLGEMVVAVVVGSIELATLQQACRTQLAPYQQPMHVERMEALPRTALGKVQKFVLRDQLAVRELGARFRRMLT